MLPRAGGSCKRRSLVLGCAPVKIADRKALVRIGLGLGIFTVGGWAAGCFMCRCGGTGQRVLGSAPIPPENLRTHVQVLAGEVGERNVYNPTALARAADYIEQQWRTQGYEIVRYTYRVSDTDCANIEVTRRGTSRSNEIVLVGAHYDSVLGSPGANDNASGVAAMLELSRFFAHYGTARTIRFVAFVNEEPPFFETERMGSRVYAKMARARGDDIRAMLSLETMGYYSDARRSQHYPAIFSLFYSDRGNFIAFVSDFSSRQSLLQAVAAFRAHSDFPVECVATSRRIVGIGWSDHGSFWLNGYPALMVTDTAVFRYPYYHTVEDTPDKVNYDALARVTEGLCGVVTSLAASD